MRKKAISYLIIISLITGLSCYYGNSADVNAKKNESIQDETNELRLRPTVSKAKWKKEKKGNYPVYYNDVEWDSLSYKSALEACEMPLDLLEEMPTDELAKYVVNYPYLADIYSFDTIENGIEHLMKTSNICSEFFSREDWAEQMIEEYETFECDYHEVLEGNETETVKYFQESFMETYLGNHSNELSDMQVSDISDAMAEKFDKKPEGIRDSYLTTAYFNAEYEVSGEITEEAIPENMVEYFEETTPSLAGFTGLEEYRIAKYEVFARAFYYEVQYGKYYKYNTSMYCYKFNCGDDIDSVTKTNLENYYKSIHPTWTIVSPATVKYNCHSYAWLSTSTSNKIWLDSPDKFASSSSFSKIGKNKTCKKNDKVVLNASYYTIVDDNGRSKALHSVIMNSSTKCTSKLGSVGVYKTSLDDMITFYGADHYVVYRAN